MPLPTLSPFSPLASVLNDIQRCIDAQLYYPALLVSLTVPEICAGLALDRSIFVKEKEYVAFVDKYSEKVGLKLLGLSGIECYRLRGGVVHRGSMVGHPKFDSTHVIFTLPESNAKMHGFSIETISENAAFFDIQTFCGAMIAAARAWYEDHQNDAVVAKNMPNLIRYCPTGLPPFVGGQPVVASGE